MAICDIVRDNVFLNDIEDEAQDMYLITRGEQRLRSICAVSLD